MKEAGEFNMQRFFRSFSSSTAVIQYTSISEYFDIILSVINRLRLMEPYTAAAIREVITNTGVGNI
jgi:hypothetical protein